MSRTLYTKGLTHEGILQAVKAAIDAGVPEIHVGYYHCAVCGEALDSVEDTELLHYEPQPSTVVHLHLCPECHRECRRAGKT